MFFSILKNATNGDQILLRKLDECVSATGDDENDPSYAVQINFNPLLEGNKGGSQTDIVKDMLHFKDTKAAAVLNHPVIETFLEIKWRRIRPIFFLNFFVYLVFLVSYSLFLGNMFYRTEKPHRVSIQDLRLENGKIYFDSPTLNEAVKAANKKAEEQAVKYEADKILFEQSQADGAGNLQSDAVDFTNRNAIFSTTSPPFLFPSTSEEVTNTTGRPAFHQCLYGSNRLECVLESVLLLSVVLLATQEFMQAYALGFGTYLRELENILELVVIVLALCGVGMQHDMNVVKWFSAFGVCLAYLELIFLMGRYPFLGGSISLMFYSITRHLARTLSNFLVLVMAFAFGFFIIHHNKESDQFENPWKAMLKTTTMVLGEFEFNDLYEAHVDDPYSLTFTMILLVGLAIMGSLVLVNLIVALIVSDIGELRKMAHLQELINKAQHIVHIESILNYVFHCCLTLRNRIRIPNIALICSHYICSCSARKIDPELVKELTKIVRKRKILGQIENLSADSASEKQMTLVVKMVMEQYKKRATVDKDVTNVLMDLAEILIDGHI